MGRRTTKTKTRKIFVLQHAHQNNGFDAEYLAFATLDDAEYKADDLIEEYCKDYTDEEKDEVDAWRSWDYSNGKDDEWFVRIDEAILYEEDEDAVSEESLKTEMARIAQPDPLEDVDDSSTTAVSDNFLNKYTKKELISILCAYDNYIQDWYATHDEGCPACLAEFIDNEYEEEDE